MNKITVVMLIIIASWLVLYALSRLNIPIIPFIIALCFIVFIVFIQKKA